jgi:Flp pilus assembly protein TadD
LPAHWICALVFFVTLLAYFPALQGGFIWDDAAHVTRRDLQSLHGLKHIWFDVGATQQYYPLLHTAFWMEHRLWGDSPLGYHLLNILLHATAACLLGVTLRRLAVPGAWLAALLFALHPVCVESVAWISEQKNTLSAVLYFCAMLAYFRFEEERRLSSYVLATGIFLAALLTKTVTATLPATLLVIFWWRRGRLSWWQDLAPLLPWFALGAAAGGLTSWVEHAHVGASGPDFALTIVQRGLLAGRVIWFYLGRLFWPADLTFIYPRWTVDARVSWQWLFPFSTLALLIALLIRRHRGALAVLLCFVGTLFPALGFINVYPFIFSFVADHFQYLACTGILALVAAGVASFMARISWSGGILPAGLLLAALGILTWQQAGMYRNVFTLYEATIAKNPGCWMAHNNLAEALTEAGRPREAIPHLEQALRLRPDYPEAENNLGNDLGILGRPREAIPHLERALKLQPAFAEAHNNLGVAFMMTGRSADGIAEMEKALSLKPGYPVARLNLGVARANTGHPLEAIAEFAEAVRLDPGFAKAHLRLAQALRRVGRIEEADAHYREAMRLNPNLPPTDN